VDSLTVAAPLHLTPAAAGMARDLGRMREEMDIQALCDAFDLRGMAGARRHAGWLDDGVRMEFGRRRRAQLFELGWIV